MSLSLRRQRLKPARRFGLVCASVLFASGATFAQGPVISYERATTLLKDYPFIRSSALASFDVPFTPDVPSHGRQPQLPNQSLALPPEIAALNGKTVSIRGFMLPVEVKPGGVRKFILTATIDSCHWGMIGLANEWVLVEMAQDKHVPYVRLQPVVLFGRLSVEPQWRGTQLTGLYRLRADYLLTDGP